MTAVTHFYTLAHSFIALIGAVLLLAIWYNIRKRFQQRLQDDDQQRVDKGLLYLSAAIFIWVAAGAWAYLSNFFPQAVALIALGEHLLSTTNNLFILLALFYFSHAPGFIYNNDKNVYTIIGIILLTFALTLLLFWWSPDSAFIDWSALPDWLLSSFLSYLLAYSLYKTFVDRGLLVVALIAVGAVFLMFLAQLPAVFLGFKIGMAANLLQLISKAWLIAIFLVLATSWVIELANKPSPNEMQLHLLDWSLIKLTIPSKGIYQQVVDFGSKTTQYKNLFKFALRRKLGQGEEQCLTIGARGEIKNQTYLSRIIDNCNQILALSPETALERRDLFTFIGDGRYRLRMLPQHIIIEEDLLKEFIHSPENQTYKTIVSNCNSTTIPNN